MFNFLKWFKSSKTEVKNNKADEQIKALQSLVTIQYQEYLKNLAWQNIIISGLVMKYTDGVGVLTTEDIQQVETLSARTTFDETTNEISVFCEEIKEEELE